MNVVILIALAAMALVGLDLALRPARHVRASAERVERGRAIPLEALQHRLFPRFETPRAYRLTGLFIIAAAVILAAATIFDFKGA